MLVREYGVNIDYSHHHTVFTWHGFSAENHYDIVNVHSHRSSAVPICGLVLTIEAVYHSFFLYLYLTNPNLFRYGLLFNII